MKNALHMQPPEDAAEAKLEHASCSIEKTMRGKTKGEEGRAYHLKARLSPRHGCRATGEVEYSVNVDECAYWLEGEVTIPFEDFELLGVDPEGGFDDEKVMLTIASLALSLELEPARITSAGVVFSVSDVGTGLFLHRGDEVVVEVHAKRAASGCF